MLASVTAAVQARQKFLIALLGKRLICNSTPRRPHMTHEMAWCRSNEPAKKKGETTSRKIFARKSKMQEVRNFDFGSRMQKKRVAQ
jgi:hypothetical protein